MPDDRWGTRLRDLRVPSWSVPGVASLVFAWLYRTLRDRREIDAASDALAKAATLLAERMKQGDERDAQMLELTDRLEAMTRTLVNFTKASLAIAAVSLTVAAAALIVAIIAA
jgi:hypothetical protein